LGITSAIVALIAQSKLENSFNSLWFYEIMLVTAWISYLGISSQMQKKPLTLISPVKLNCDEWISLSQSEFQKNKINIMTDHYEENEKLVTSKAKTARKMTWLLLLKTVFIVVWFVCIKASPS